ncbi:MAG TPA: DUF2235 domain-containing protein [Sphingobacteriaceae bacterium]
MKKRILIGLVVPVLLIQSCSIRTIPQPYLNNKRTYPRPHVLAVFMDGTNNKANKDPLRNTHVKTTHSLVKREIRSMYIEGVGTRKKLAGGLLGLGTKARVVKAYRFLSEYYAPGDSICLFGFSRGANQCRILSNLVYTVGVLDLKEVEEEREKMKLIKQTYKLYRKKYYTPGEKKANAANYLSSWNEKNPVNQVYYDTTSKTRIELMGLWDTVEAFKLDGKETTGPRKDHLNQIENVKKVFHAVALDDNRALTYTPVLLTSAEVSVASGIDMDSVVEEVWFSGSHRDVGGSHKNDPYLQDISLNWMLSKTKPYNLFHNTSITEYIYAQPHNMLEQKIMRIPFKNLNRNIAGYYKDMAPAYNNGRLKVHNSVILRLQEGVVPDFKATRGRVDWFDQAPFKDCFIKDGRKRIFKEDCNCIERVN